MKHFLTLFSHRQQFVFIFFFIIVSGIFTACHKYDDPFKGRNDPSFYSSDVIDKWMTLEIRIYTDATGFSNGGFARPFAYSGISAYESIDPGLASWKNKYNGLSGLPETEMNKRYDWSASVNASLAEFNRSFFNSTNLNATDLAAIDSLENAIYAGFSNDGTDVLERSVGFGKSIADAVFLWSQTDGFNQNNVLPYTWPVGPGLWIPTPPSNSKPSGPFWPNDRLIIAGSGDNAEPGPPTPYSEDPTSAFYKQVNDVYQASKVLTTDQKNQALYWRDVGPGVTTPGHWMSILQQVIRLTHSRLDKAALSYALVGISLNDAVLSAWDIKYKYNLIRPVSYIRAVIGDATWLPLIVTPAHPEYSSAHAVISSSASEALTAVYGNIGTFTDHTYDYLSYPPRSFKTFRDIGIDAGNSRFYGGIHYQPTVNSGLIQGRTVGGNIVRILGQISYDGK
jgi:hypothetical protein